VTVSVPCSSGIRRTKSLACSPTWEVIHSPKQLRER
jgi:hypothetical protein